MFTNFDHKIKIWLNLDETKENKKKSWAEIYKSSVNVTKVSGEKGFHEISIIFRWKFLDFFMNYQL